MGAFACLLAFLLAFFFCCLRILVARPRSTLCRIYYYTPTPYTYKASAFSPHVTRAGSCVPQSEVSTLIVYGWWFTRSRAVLQQLYLVSVLVPKFRFCSHIRIFLVVWFTDDHGLCSCVRARVEPQLLYYIYIDKLRLCSHLRIFLVVRFTDDRGICSCVHAHVVPQQLYYI